MAADDYMPFSEVYLIPSFLSLAYVTTVVIYFFFKNKEDYYRTCIFLFTGMTIFLIVSTLWPNGMILLIRLICRTLLRLIIWKSLW